MNCGTYSYSAVAFDDLGASDTCVLVNLIVIPPGKGTGKVYRQIWRNIAGAEVIKLTSNVNYPYNADFVDTITNFEAPEVTNGNNYGQRMSACLIPPSSGMYTFWIASDDNSVLNLSTDSLAANKKQIAAVNGWTNPREWDGGPSQKSEAISLEEGKKYYIEAIQKQGDGGNNLGVAWSGPCIGRTVITGDYLSLNSFNEYNHLPAVTITYPLATTTIHEHDTIIIVADATDTDGTIDSVQFYISNKLVATAKTSPYSYTWNNIPIKKYDIKARVWDNMKGNTYSPVVKVNVISGSSVQTVARESITLFPNPAVQGNFTMTNMPNGNKVISILNITGQVIANYETSNSEYAIGNLRLVPGIYMVKVSVGNWNTVQKLIVK